MPRDYYGVLGCERTATNTEIARCYQWAATKWHPQKNPGRKQEAEQRFAEIAEAFDVLNDPERRHRYDRLGEIGLKHTSPGSGTAPYKYVGDPFKLFNDFFASADPFALATAKDFECAAPGLNNKVPEPELVIEVPCTRVELMEGQQKRLQVDRTRLGPNGSPCQDPKPVMLPVSPGWKIGMRVVFQGEGNHTDPAKAPGDLVLVVTTKEAALN